VINSAQWFTEFSAESGLAFSLQIKEKLHDERSSFQHIEIYDTTHFGRLMVLDGCIMLTSRDNFIYHEMMSHPALFTHSAPKRVLIIGGGDCGTLREVLKHGEVEKVIQVDIDERVTRLSEKYFPELCENNNDPRVQLVFADGIDWVRQSSSNAYDVIIVDSTDPVGPGEILFSEEFYQNCRNALADKGIFVQQSESPLLHNKQIIQPMIKRLSRAGFAQQQTLLFPQCVYPSGWWSCTLASTNIALDRFRGQGNVNCNLPALYYNPKIHEAASKHPEFMK